MPIGDNMGRVDVGESVLGITIFDSVSKKFIDLLKVCLLEACGNTHLPEIYDVFGPDHVLKFLDVFSGVTFKVPQVKILKDCVRDVSVYLVIDRTPAGSRGGIIKDLASKYDVSTGKIRRIYSSMVDKLSRYSVK